MEGTGYLQYWACVGRYRISTELDMSWKVQDLYSTGHVLEDTGSLQYKACVGRYRISTVLEGTGYLQYLTCIGRYRVLDM